MILLDNLQKNKGESLAIFEQTTNVVTPDISYNDIRYKEVHTIAQ